MAVTVCIGNGPVCGSVIRYGNYPFISDRFDFTPVEWTVLSASPPHSFLLISRYIIDTVPEDFPMPGEKPEDAARRYMNEQLVPRIFSEKQCEFLIPFTDRGQTEEEARRNGQFCLLPDPTYIRGYMRLPELRRASVTDYAQERDAFTSWEADEDGQHYGRWMLCPEGDLMSYKYVITDEHGDFKVSKREMYGLGLRPVIRLDRRAEFTSGKNDPKQKWSHRLFADEF